VGKLLKKAKEATEKKINENVNEGLNKVLGNEEEQKEAGKEVAAEKQSAPVKNEAVSGSVKEEEAAPVLVWSKYDFVPGDKIIFEDNLEGEENGEFPSRWDLQAGTVENAVFGGENVIMFRGGAPAIIPFIKNSNIDYLPEVFTIEFDLFFPDNSFTVYFYDRKNQRAPSGSSNLMIRPEQMELGSASSRLPNNESISKKWAHISVAYTSGQLKAYIDETRLINIPHLAFDPTGITLHAYSANDNRPFYVKNIRIAEGGVKYYDRFIQDGKIVSNGIRFDVGKASLRPESMGVLNEIYKMLSDHPDIKVSIEGHTDSDGDADLNLKLSEERAITVMKQLESMGISADRLTSKGYGESKPFGPNDTPEGKAANRRVEFVKDDGNSTSQ
jgi:outer membrane protein OmpA-like peptidoglycan-associated protein